MKHETKAARVYDWHRAYIDERKFSLDNKLPSENMLRGRLRVSRDTVRCAMKRLEEEGLIFRLKGSGTYINKAATLPREFYVKWCASNEAHDLSYAKEITRFIRAIPKCAAIVCCSYMIPQTVLMVLKKAGKRIPEDYSVVCFDYSGKDWELTRITCSVSQGCDMGIMAANQLIKMLLEGAADQWKAQTIVVDPLIHEGSSVGRVRLPS